IAARILRPDAGKLGADRRPDFPDDVAAVAAGVHELPPALIDVLCARGHGEPHAREDQARCECPARHRATSAFDFRTVNTGHGARRITLSATEPSRARFRPVRPWV